MALRKQRIVTSPDGRRWTVAREVLPARPKARRKYPHDLDPDPVWNWSILLWGAPCAVVVVLALTVVVVPAVAALILGAIGWAGARYQLRRRVQGRSPWKVVASTPPTEYEHGEQFAWAVLGVAESERAVDECANAIHAGTPPTALRPGPPVSV